MGIPSRRSQRASGVRFAAALAGALLHPPSAKDAIEVDAAIRRLPKMRASTFLHRECESLSEIDLRSPKERGQLSVLDGECGGAVGDLKPKRARIRPSGGKR
jgi:hypothetical protein